MNLFYFLNLIHLHPTFLSSGNARWLILFSEAILHRLPYDYYELLLLLPNSLEKLVGQPFPTCPKLRNTLVYNENKIPQAAKFPGQTFH